MIKFLFECFLAGADDCEEKPVRTTLLSFVLSVLSTAPAPGQTKDVDGWAQARWGMTLKGVLSAFQGEVKRLGSHPAMRQFGDQLAEIGIERTKFIGVPLQAYFFFDASRGLEGVLLRSAEGILASYASEYFKILESGLGRDYGEPSVRGENKDGTSLLSAWILPTTVIELSFIDAGSLKVSIVAVKFQKRIAQTAESVRGNLSPVTGQHFPKFVVVMTKPVEAKELAAQDDSMSISFLMEKQAIGFELQNKTESPIKIDWDQVSFVGSTGTAVKVIHSGVRLIERDRPQAPTVIPPGARIREQITPVDRIQYEKGWRVLPLLPERSLQMRDLCGKKFQVFIPVDIGAKIKNNTFEFRIDCG